MKLKQCSVFGNLSESEREILYQKLTATTKRYEKDDIIARQGDTVHSLYLLAKGRVKTEMNTESGGVLAVEVISAPLPLAPAFLFAENNRFPVDVIALEYCEVILIPKRSVMQHLATNEEFLQTYMAFNADRTQFLSERLQLLSIKTIKGKLASYILQRASGNRFSLNRNQTELAEYFGVARPSLARSLTDMVDDGAITRDGQILNIDILKKYVVN